MMKMHIFLLYILLIFHREVHKAHNRIFWQLFMGYIFYFNFFFVKVHLLGLRSGTEIKTSVPAVWTSCNNGTSFFMCGHKIKTQELSLL